MLRRLTPNQWKKRKEKTRNDYLNFDFILKGIITDKKEINAKRKTICVVVILVSLESIPIIRLDIIWQKKYMIFK